MTIYLYTLNRSGRLDQRQRHPRWRSNLHHSRLQPNCQCLQWMGTLSRRMARSRSKTPTNNLKCLISSPSLSFMCVVPPSVPVKERRICQVIKLGRISKAPNDVSYASHRTTTLPAVPEPSFLLEGPIKTEMILTCVDNGPMLPETTIESHKPLGIF